MSSLIQLITETATCIGTGIFGLTYILLEGDSYKITKYVLLTGIGTAIAISLIKEKRQRKVNEQNVIFITGCDSGLGYNMALYCHHELNMFVVAGCLSEKSEGAQMLLDRCNAKRFVLMELDIRKSASILHAEKTLLSLLTNNRDLEFTCFVNNAGVMSFGEFEWQTNAIIENQINTNLVGTMLLTRSLLPLIRQYKTRILNVTSHCALEALPGLAPYAASKAGLRFWNDALRVELRKYGIDVVNFIPGSLVMSTNITARQEQYTTEMLQAFSDEQIEFYEEYFVRYMGYLKYISGVKPVQRIKDKNLFLNFRDAVLDCSPGAVYKSEPPRYAIYHFLCKYSPVFIRDRLIVKFVNMPEY